MNDDKALLEAAARAAGVDAWWSEIHSTMFLADRYDGGTDYQADAVWNPLTDDGDALRLAATLHIDVCWNRNEGPWEVNAWPSDGGTGSGEGPEDHADDPYAATRRAIVRAAASLQETKNG